MKYGKEVIKILDTYVEGQDEVKEMLSACLVKHFLKTFKHYNDDEKLFCKSNGLILGPTGCGKSYMMQVLKENINYPVIDINGAELSTNGWAGDSLASHLENAAKDIPKILLKYAIVFIDEIDKLCYSRTSSGGENVNKSIQQCLLKALEGQVMGTDRGTFSIDTSEMLFIFGGNFQELRQRLQNRKSSIGFKQEAPEKVDLSEIHQELIHFGMIPELAGRISMISEVKPLTRNQMRKILLNKKAGPLKEYNQIFKYVGLDKVELSNYHINKIIDVCMKKEVGARGLNAAVDKYMKDILLESDYDVSLGVLKGEEVPDDSTEGS